MGGLCNSSQRQARLREGRPRPNGNPLPCGYSENDGKSLAGELVGTDGQHKKTQKVLCQEYTLQTDRVTYRIRPKDDKHPMLLPIGESAEFRIHKDKLLLRVPEAGDKEREYIVLSMTPRTDAGGNKTASASVKP